LDCGLLALVGSTRQFIIRNGSSESVSGFTALKMKNGRPDRQGDYTGSSDPKCELVHKTDVRGGLDSLEDPAKIYQFGREMERKLSALEQQAADVLRRARRLPIGAERNDLRQLAMGLLWLHRNGMDALNGAALGIPAAHGASRTRAGRLETRPFG
jgi:hypothetical protein